ncbi:MAG: acyltransferase [Muribaculaceae bacterium]|nr:acyltransferase [Muribaculaceae bacterium]
MKAKQALFLALYYGVARWLPPSFYPGGKIWRSFRVFCCRNIFEYCGKNINIEHGASFGPGTNVRIGNNSGLGVNARIKRNTVIGDNVMMGPGFVVQESRHCFDRTDIPMNQQPVLPPQQVIIGNDVWIGSDVMAIGNRHIADGSIIGARTVLVKDFESYSIVGGNPSRLIRNRKSAK